MSNNLNQGASEAELLPCPFCGTRDLQLYSEGDSWIYVLCSTDGCEVEGPPKATDAEAITAWNRRTPAATTGTAPSVTAWEQRALEAERNLEGALRALGAENGATFMGEPVLASRASPSIDAMVERFLGWPLPKDFSPDCGISFDGRGPDARGYDRGWPTGTNLLAATQVKAMLEYVLAAPASAQPADPLDWPLPCDVKVGGVNIRKGCKLRTLVTRMESLHRMAMKAFPEPTPEARALVDSMIAGTWKPEDGAQPDQRESARTITQAGFIKPSWEEANCTCPSGDGSLRWPCPAHPPAAQPVAKDER